MEERNLTELKRRGLSFLRISRAEWDSLHESRTRGNRFSLTFAHDMARNARVRSIVLIEPDSKDFGLRIGYVRSIQAVSTLQSRVTMDLVRPITPASIEGLLQQITSSTIRAAVTNFRQSDVALRAVSPKLGERLFDLIAASPENAPALQRIVSELERPERFDNARGMQQDAVGLALKTFGLIDEAESLNLPGRDTALGLVRLQEDAVIEHDARWLPGWQLAQSDLTGRAVFRRQNDQLEIFTANKRPLEQLFGVDLIYLNRTRESLVMVQYKMMEAEPRKHRQVSVGPYIHTIPDEKDWTVPIDAQFQAEMTRMARFDKDIARKGAYRLSSSPFFFKLIKRNAAINTSAIMLSMEHLDHMITTGPASGPKGGLRISYRELGGHYLRSDPFIELVRSGYVGTRGGTTKHLESLIEATLNGGRAVVAAIQAKLGDKT